MAHDVQNNPTKEVKYALVFLVLFVSLSGWILWGGITRPSAPATLEETKQIIGLKDEETVDETATAEAPAPSAETTAPAVDAMAPAADATTPTTADATATSETTSPVASDTATATASAPDSSSSSTSTSATTTP